MRDLNISGVSFGVYIDNVYIMFPPGTSKSTVQVVAQAVADAWASIGLSAGDSYTMGVEGGAGVEVRVGGVVVAIPENREALVLGAGVWHDDDRRLERLRATLQRVDPCETDVALAIVRACGLPALVCDAGLGAAGVLAEADALIAALVRDRFPLMDDVQRAALKCMPCAQGGLALPDTIAVMRDFGPDNRALFVVGCRRAGGGIRGVLGRGRVNGALLGRIP
jgi:hypothetical protein